ncbi:hypothetical protein [Luteibacter yeojuensis]|uniref:Uncharacterized protein n=1 Tax=Luteibacter yeojuensis TaxID=345309 RepID=A0A7X5QSP1_9GAMM|nr:hypothetical protein [Luteibacter yeojuensis]NID14693.1 hypothetical protein [Luteibacter yeojuensis]
MIVPAAVIPRHRVDDPLAYDALRARALAALQELSGEQWTDYNYHDPGVTLLDAFCFALTEDIFGARQPLADLLSSPDGRIHYRALGLRAAEDILPCRPCTAMDYMRWLLDRVPGALQAHVRSHAGDGLWQVQLEVATPDDAVAAAARAYWAQRNLCEDLDGLPSVLQPRWCTLNVHLGIEGTRAPEEILAELVERCARYVDAAPERLSLSTRLAEEGSDVSLADVLDGPRLHQGWIETERLALDRDGRIYFGDLARIALSVEGVFEVARIDLDADGLAGTGDALPRRGDGWVLRLRWPDHRDAIKNWTVHRRGNRIAVAADALLQRLDDLRRNGQGRATADSAPEMPGSPLNRPQGNYVPPRPYVSLLKQLPHIYRERYAAASTAQFHAYVALLEQWLAHGGAQTRYLRDLYTTRPRPRASYAWDVLADAQLAGLEALYTTDRERLREQVFAAADDALERRGRVLDHQLALYGEGCWQGSIRPFGWYFSAEGWRAHLIEQKRLFLVRIATLTRDRHGGIDYSRRSLGRRGNTPALQQRVSLLLGFKYHHSRLLMKPMKSAGVALAAESARLEATQDAPAEAHPPVVWGPGRHRVVEAMGPGLASAARALAQYFPTLDPAALPPALLRSAVHAERYRHADATALWLGSDEQGPSWVLPLRSPRASAEAAAMCLHEFACRLQLECEGMHLVEHMLLRPPAADEDDPPVDFYPHRLTAVFPAWTARGQHASFRRVALETLTLNAPAHLRVETVWLDARAMRHFERRYAAWLEAMQSYGSHRLAHAAETAASATRVERCARSLRRQIWRELQRGLPASPAEPDRST